MVSPQIGDTRGGPWAVPPPLATPLGLWDFKPKSLTKRRVTTLRLTSASFSSSTARILLAELIEDHTAALRMTWSSHGVVFRGRPDLLASE